MVSFLIVLQCYHWWYRKSFKGIHMQLMYDTACFQLTTSVRNTSRYSFVSSKSLTCINFIQIICSVHLLMVKTLHVFQNTQQQQCQDTNSFWSDQKVKMWSHDIINDQRPSSVSGKRKNSLQLHLIILIHMRKRLSIKVFVARFERPKTSLIKGQVKEKTAKI